MHHRVVGSVVLEVERKKGRAPALLKVEGGPMLSRPLSTGEEFPDYPLAEQ
jgi:hypothetical protein